MVDCRKNIRLWPDIRRGRIFGKLLDLRRGDYTITLEEGSYYNILAQICSFRTARRRNRIRFSGTLSKMAGQNIE